MIHLPPLITDLGLILILAALSTLLFKGFGQPQVLGYLIAGFLVSHHVSFLPTVKDNESIQVWSEIGIIFLLFSLGLEFSFKKLFKVGGAASFTAAFEVVFMITVAYLVGRISGWNNIDSLFFGGILSISSTTIIVRAFHEAGLRGQKYVEFVFGVLVVEDIIAILLLVLLTAIAKSGVFSGLELAMSGFRLLFYISLWFVVGIFLIPFFLRLIRPLLEDENMLLVSLALCFVMVMIADSVGFSSALGAFVMGSLLAETPEGHKMESLIQPVKNLFAAIFFVSVGMMIDPKVFMEHWSLVLLVTLITIAGKFIGTFLGAILSGQHRKKSFQAGMSMAQIGEFSFIIASVGVKLKVASDFLYPLAIAVSAVTTFATPYLIKATEPASHWLDKFLPTKIKLSMDRYHSSFNHQNKATVGSLIFATYGVKTLLNGIMIIAILSAFKTVLNEEIQKHLIQHSWAGAFSLLICLLLSAPFFWGLVMSGPTLRSQRELDDLQKLRRLQFGLFLGRLIIAILLLGSIISQFVSLRMTWGLIVIVLVIAILTSQVWVRWTYQIIEKNFLKNLTEKERKELLSAKLAKNFLPWEASLATYEIPSDSDLVGKSLGAQSFKEKHGLSVAAVFRGAKNLFAPDGDFILWPYDELLCFGDEEDLQKFHSFLEKEKSDHLFTIDAKFRQDEYQLSSLTLTFDSPHVDKSIRDSGIRETLKAMVVGIERGPQKILGPTANFILRENDLVWMVSQKTVHPPKVL